MPFESLGHGPLMHTPTSKKRKKEIEMHTVTQTNIPVYKIYRSGLACFYLKAKNETQQENKEHKKKAGNKVVSGVSITSEIPDFLTHCSWNKIEQLYSGVQSVQEGVIKYKLYHITLYLPTEPFGYNYTPVRYAGPASLVFL